MSVDLNQKNKKIVWNLWRQLETAAPGERQGLLDSVMCRNVSWHGHDPINELSGTEAVLARFWAPLFHSFPDLKRHTHLFFGGKSNGRNDGDSSKDGRMWVTGTGYFSGTFTRDYETVPATGTGVTIRWGEFCCMEDGKIVTVYIMLDLIDFMQQAGINVLPRSLGTDGDYPPPKAADGVVLTAQDVKESEYTLAHIRRFIFEGLNQYDELNLESMGMATFFHPGIHWYGPGGIGACYSLREFEDNHQAPWLHAYPDRQVQDLDGLIAEGNYSGGTGWAGVIATHKGEYKGAPATGKRIKFNGLDWWKRESGQVIENWVFVDMIHLFRQFGINLFERM